MNISEEFVPLYRLDLEDDYEAYYLMKSVDEYVITSAGVQTGTKSIHTVQITFIFIDFRVCDFAFAFKTQNAPCVSRFKRVLFSDRFQFAF